MPVIRTVGELKKALENVSDDTQLVKARLHVKLVKAHFLDGQFHTFHYGEGFNCCSVIGYLNNSNHKYELLNALVID